MGFLNIFYCVYLPIVVSCINLAQLDSTKVISDTEEFKTTVLAQVLQSQASCSLEGTVVKTFNNVTYNFDPKVAQNCSHILVQDCLGKNALSISVMNTGTKLLETSILIPGNIWIEIFPAKIGENSSDLISSIFESIKGHREIQVSVNDELISSLPLELKDNEGNFVARIEAGPANPDDWYSIQVFYEDVLVLADAVRVVVYAGSEFKNRSCGLCGNFHGSKSKDKKSPTHCLLSSGTLMYAAYSFDRPWKDSKVVECKVSDNVKQAIQREERDCEEESIDVHVSATCQDQLLQNIKEAVYHVIKGVLKVIPFVNGEKWANNARNEISKLLVGKIKTDDIADIIASGISISVPYIGDMIKPAIKKAVKPILKIICRKSGCCDSYYVF